MNESASTNAALNAWVRVVAEQTQPAQIHWWSGTRGERAELAAAMVRSGRLIALDPQAHPRSFLFRNDPRDADVEHDTFVATNRRVDAGPTNVWMSLDEAHRRIWSLFQGSMQARTMYVVPYLLGPLRSRAARVGVEITDSPYVVLALDTLTRAGNVALSELGSSLNFARGLHSTLDLSPHKRVVVLFPDTVETWSAGSEQLETALFSSGAQGLRLASAQACDEGWLAEHMTVLAVKSPEGGVLYLAVASAEGCEIPELVAPWGPWGDCMVERLSGDVCWLRAGDDGRLRAFDPDWGRWQRTSELRLGAPPTADAIFTNVALRAGGRPWWEGLDSLEKNEFLESWRGISWRPRATLSHAAHPRAHCLMPIKAATAARDLRSPSGVPISAILFCGRHDRSSPVVYEARSWRHAVYVGATLVNEAEGTDSPRHDPMGMLKYCGYNLGDYFSHWLSVGRKLHYPPKVFHLNWSRTDTEGRAPWQPRESGQILKWIVDRIEGTASARSAPFGLVPELEALDLSGLDVPQDRLMQALSGNHRALLRQAERARAFLGRFGDCLPDGLLSEHRYLVKHLQESLH